AVEVALNAPDVTALLVRQGSRRRLTCSQIAFQCRVELKPSIGERAVGTHDLPAVHRALTGQAHQFRLRVDPPRESACPLRGTTVVADFLACLDEGAVGLA